MRSSGPALLAMLAMLLAGCLPAATPAPTLPPPTSTPTPLPPTTTPALLSPAPLVTTLTLWVPPELNPYDEGAEAALLAERLESFGQAHEDLQVGVIVKKAQGRGGLLDFLRTASVAAPSVLPDLVVLRTADLRVAAWSGLLQPLDSLLPEELAAERFPYAVALGQVDGQTVGIPFAVEVEHLAYRPSLIARPPVTWTDVLSSGTSFVFPAAGQENGVNDATLVQYLGAGGRLTDGEGKPQLEVEPLTAVLEFYTQAVAAGVISPTVVRSITHTDGCWSLFQNGQAGMAVVNSRRFWTERESMAAPAAIPTKDGRVVALARGWTLALVTADPQRQGQAMELLAWLFDPEWYGTWTQYTGYLPATRGGLAAWNMPEEERAVLEALLEGAQADPLSMVRAAIGPPLQEALDGVLSGRLSPAEAAADAAREVEP